MTTVTRTPLPATSAGIRSAAIDLLRSEWAKLRTVRSTWWTLLSVLGGTIAVGLIICAASAAHWDQMTRADRTGFDPTLKSLTGLFVGELAIGVLGVLAITSEYATGMIRSTLAAVPQRRLVLAAKAAALALPAFGVSALACFAAFLGGQALLAGKHIGVSIGAPGELRAVLGATLYLTVLALFGLGLGGIFRRTAGAISAFTGLVLIAPIIISSLPSPWGRDIAEYLPSNAGQAILSVHATAGFLPPWTGFGVLCGWTAAALGTAAWLITRRDA